MVAKKKKTTRKRVAKQHTSHKNVEKKEIEPAYMVQLSDPKLVRKDLLESLREVIIFMQGYEKFRRIQEEKIALFTQLRVEVKQLSILVNDKLRKYLPKGKLRAVSPQKKEEEPYDSHDEQPPFATGAPPSVSAPPSPQEPEEDNLAQLEGQLRDIERQLQGIR